jgi:hypothetical protein
MREIRTMHLCLGDGVSNLRVTRRTKPIMIRGKTVKNAKPLFGFSVWGAEARGGVSGIISARGEDLRQYVANGFSLGRVLEVSEQDVRQTYDLEIEGSHNFIADGIVVHNSGFASAVLKAGGLLANPPAKIALDVAGFERWGVPGQGELTVWVRNDSVQEHCFLEFKGFQHRYCEASHPGTNCRWLEYETFTDFIPRTI